jgi:chloramphenicol 3-O phosphotransferase
MSDPVRIVILNGVGSAGKSSIARALQGIVGECYLHVALDAFLEMMPASRFGHPDGYVFETVEQDGKPAVVIHTGPDFQRALRGMRRAMAALAAEGNNLIVDEVLFGDELQDYRAVLAPFQVFLVGVMAPLDVLEARERARGDREIGLARWQFDRVHRGVSYDLEVDTSTASPLACAEAIKAAFGL